VSDGTSVQTRLADVVNALQQLNSVKLRHYQNLTEASRALNKVLTIDQLGEERVPEQFGSDVILAD